MNEVKKAFVLKFNVTNETLLGFLLAFVVFCLSFLLSMFINKSVFMTILIRDILMVFGVTFFCLFYIKNKNYKFEEFGLSFNKWHIFLSINFLLAVALLFLFIDEHPDAKLDFNIKTFLLISYIMLSGIFEMVVFYSFLRKIFEDAFGIIPGIILASIAYILHHTGDQPEFGKLFFVGILYGSVFRMGNSILLDYPFFWGVGACFDVLIVSDEVKEIIYPGARSLLLLILFIASLVLIFNKNRKDLKMKKIFLLGMFLLLNSVVMAVDSVGEIKIVMTNFRNDKGTVKVALYNSKEGFPDDNKKALKLEKVKIEDRKAETVFSNISYGIYAIAIYHDENENDKLDENWLGIPKEGYGVSNNAKGVMGPPKYDDAKFDVKDRTTAIEIKVCY